MTKFELTDKYIKRVDSQFKLWASFLNNGIGLLAFSLALASLGTKAPVVNSWLSIAVIILVRFQGSRFFPEEIQNLKKQAKLDPKSKVILDGFDKRYFGFKTNFTQYPLFLFGFIFLFLVAFSHQISAVIPSWGSYVGI